MRPTNAEKTRRAGETVNHVKKEMLETVLLFSVTEAAQALACSDRKVFNLVRDGKIIAVTDRPGGKGIRITGKALQNYIKSITIDPEYWQR